MNPVGVLLFQELVFASFAYNSLSDDALADVNGDLLAYYALQQASHRVDLALEGRGDVLAKMAESISEPGELSPYAPRIETVTIPQDRIGELIGPGGKNIKAIQAESGAV